MNITLTGGTGFIGGALVKRLLSDDHSLTLLGRSMKKGLDPKTRFALWESMEGPPPQQTLQDADAVIHLAGEPISQRWTPEIKRRIRDSRVIGTNNLVTGLRNLEKRPKVLIAASAIGYYGDRGEETLTESAKPGRGWLPEICTEWEEASAAARDLGMRVVQIRIGIVLGRNGGALQKMLPVFKMGMGGRLGSGKQWMSWIHLRDLVELIAFALNEPKLAGPVNGTAPNPVRNSEFTDTLGSVLERPALLPVPAFSIRLLFGEMAVVVLTGQKVTPEAAGKAGFAFQYPTLRKALEDIIE